MTRLSGYRGVTKWLRARRAALAEPAAEASNAGSGDAPPIDVRVPEGVVIVLPPEEGLDLAWRGPTKAELGQAPMVERDIVASQRHAGTQRANKKRKGKRA